MWTLKRNADTTKTLAAWGFVSAALTLRSLDDDELIGTLATEEFADCPFAEADAIVLYKDGTSQFSGKVSSIRCTGQGSKLRWEITVSGPWYQLKRLMYQQKMASYDASCDIPTTVKTTKVVLFQDELLGTSTTIATEIATLCAFALAAGVTIAAGVMPAFASAPFETARDLTIADALRRCLQYIPDAVAWFDYSVDGIATFNAARRADLTTATLDLATDGGVIESFELHKRSDLIPAGVRLNYIGFRSCPLKIANGCVDPATGTTNTTGAVITSTQSQQVATITQDEIGLPDTPGGLIGTIDLAQLSDSATEAAPTGFASDYYTALLTAQYEGTVTTRAAECPGTLRPGKVLNLSNGLAAWATMAGLIQQVTEDLLAGATTASFGPPEHLAPQDFVALVQFMRRRPFVTDSFAAVRYPGSDDSPNCDAAKNPKAKDVVDAIAGNSDAAAQAFGDNADAIKDLLPTLDLEVCDDGTTKTLHIYGTDA